MVMCSAMRLLGGMGRYSSVRMTTLGICGFIFLRFVKRNKNRVKGGISITAGLLDKSQEKLNPAEAPRRKAGEEW